MHTQTVGQENHELTKVGISKKRPRSADEPHVPRQCCRVLEPFLPLPGRHDDMPFGVELHDDYP